MHRPGDAGSRLISKSCKLPCSRFRKYSVVTVRSDIVQAAQDLDSRLPDDVIAGSVRNAVSRPGIQLVVTVPCLHLRMFGCWMDVKHGSTGLIASCSTMLSLEWWLVRLVGNLGCKSSYANGRQHASVICSASCSKIEFNRFVESLLLIQVPPDRRDGGGSCSSGRGSPC